MFDRQEIEMLNVSAKDDRALDDHAFGRADDQGGVVRLSLWNHPGNGIYGMFARRRSLFD
jgi:ectoine hydroxylase